MTYQTDYYSSAGFLQEYDVITPDNLSQNRPLLIQFYGSGWYLGNRRAHYPLAETWTKAGFVVVLPEYRTEAKYGTNPSDSVEDAINIYKHILKETQRWGADPNKIVLGGGSAGAQLALMAGIQTKCQPICFVLENPALDDVILKSRCGELDYTPLSPYERLPNNCSPIIIFHGTEDKTVPISYIRQFCKKAKSLNIECELHEYPGCDHGFYMQDNLDIQKAICYFDVMAKSISFVSKYL